MRRAITISFIILLLTVVAVAQNQYFVAPSPTGNNSNNGTSVSTPWLTIGFAAANLTVGAAGATVNVAQGTYNECVSSGQTAGKSGTSTAPVKFISTTPLGAKVVCNGNLPWLNGTSSSTRVGDYVTIQGFDVTNTSTAGCHGIQSWGAFDKILQNYVHDIPAPTSNCGNGVGGEAIAIPNCCNSLTADAHGVVVDSNIISNVGNGYTTACNNQHGIYTASPSNIITNNIVAGACAIGIESFHMTTQLVISNNVVINNDEGGIQVSADPAITLNNNSSVNNNIVINNGGLHGGASICGIQEPNGVTGAANVYRNNAVFGNAGGNMCLTTGTQTGTITLTSAQESGLFVNYTGNSKTGDYQEQSGAVTINAGTNDSCASGGITPCVPAADFVGTLRPQGSAYDIGAYEFVSGSVPAANLSPSSSTFGSQMVGTSSGSTPITLSNTSSIALTISAISVTGDFSQTNNCPTMLAGMTSCTLSLKFNPTAIGTRMGTLTVTDNAVPATQSSSLSGTGTQPAVSLSNTSLTFPTTQVMVSSSPLNSILTNTGTAPLTVTSVSISGANAGDYSQTNNCVGTIAVSGTCSVNVTFRPTATGTRTAAVSIADNAPGSPHTISLSGTGAGTPVVTLNHTSLTFSGQNVGTTSSAQTFTVTNTGTAVLLISAVTTTGDFADTTSPITNCGGSLAVSAVCTVSVTFTPTAVGTRNGLVTITSSAASSPDTVTLTGTGQQAAVTLTPNPLAFGNQLVGVVSSASVITLTNSGSATLTLTSFSITGTNASDFAISANTCGGTLVSLASCTISIVFTPAASGSRTATLSVVDSAPNSPHLDTLTGTGVAPVVSLTPASLSFGSLITGSVSVAQDLTLSNAAGTAPLTITSIALTGANANQFTADSSSCGSSLAVGSSCLIHVRFAPTATGAKTASVTVTDNAAGSPHSSTLAGTGVAGSPVVQLSVTSLTFGNQTVGTTSASQPVTITNIGTATLNISSIATSGDFSLTTTCGSTLAVSANCAANVSFTPTATGTRTGTLSITDDASGSPQTVSLTGTGTAVLAPIATLSASSLTFANQPVGTSSASQPVTMQNTGTAILNIASIAASGDFSQASNCGSTLAVSAACTVNVTFTPTATGTRTGTLSFTDNAAGSPQLVSLQGSGTAPLAPIATFTPTSLTFPSTGVGGTSAPMTFTLQNTGTAVLSLASVTASGDFSDSTSPGGNCGGTLAVNAICTISVIFSPTAAGTRTGAVTFTDNATGSPQVIPLTGTGVTAASTAVVSPTSLIFPARLVGTTSGTSMNVTVTNTGTSNLTISSVGISGDFSRTLTNCVTVIPGAKCTIAVRFTPTATGTRTGILTITDNAAGSPQLVSLQGTGIAPAVTFSPASVAFGSQPVGVATAAVIVKIINSGTAQLQNIAISITGTNPGDFSFTNTGTGSCGTILGAGGTCQVKVTFTPATTGARSANLSVSSNAPGSPQTAALTGTGTSNAAAVTLNPTSLAFGSFQVGTTSPSLPVTLTNSGTASLTISSVMPSGDFADTTVPITNCGGSLAAGASCTINVTFTPTATGARTGAITITDSATGSPHVVNLTGTGTPAPAPTVSLSASSLTFTSQQVGTSSAAQTVTLTNTGSATLLISSLTITGVNAGDYSETNTCDGSVAAAASCTISVTFTPTAAGTRTASVTIADNATGTPHTISLTGTAFTGAPGALVAPIQLNFGGQSLQVPSASQPVTVTNNGSATLLISSISISGVNAADFSETTTCGGSLAVSASCTINVVFAPLDTGNRLATLSVTDNAPSSPQTVSLSGNGTGPKAKLSPASVTFASQVQGTTSAPQPVALLNTGNTTLSINSITFSGTNPTDYAQTNNCPNNLAASATCTINVTFTPQGVGSSAAMMIVTDDAIDSPQSVSLSGTGIAGTPAVSASPTSLNFGSIQQGSTTASQTVTITNTGTASLVFSSISLTGTNAADYNLSSLCTTVAVNATCTISVTFTPSSTGTRTASVTLMDNAPNSPQAIPLTGVGTPAPTPLVSLSATSLTYTLQQVGTTSAAQTVTLTNTGDASLTITSITLGLANAADFAISANTCGATLAAAANCAVSVTFTPLAAGVRNADVIFTDSASDSPQTVALTGMAFVGTPVASISPVSVSFGLWTVLTTSSLQSVVLTNTGTAALTVSSIVAASNFAPGSNEFVQTNNCPSVLAVNGNCTVLTTFTPQAAGTRTGTLTFTDNASNSPQVVPLTGVGLSAPPPPGTVVSVGIGGHSGIGGHASLGVQVSVGPPALTSCTALTTIQLPATIPFSGLLGMNQVVPDPEPLNSTPCFHNPIMRATDASFASSQGPTFTNATFFTDCGGSASRNLWNTDSTLALLCGPGDNSYPISFNPATMQVARLYATGLGTGMKLVHGGSFSYLNSQVLYKICGSQESSLCNGTTLGSFNFTNRSVQPVPSILFDFLTVLPAGFVANWHDPAQNNFNDTVFVSAFSQSVQDTGVDVVAYVAGVGGYDLNTQTGVLTGPSGIIGTIGIPDRFTVHNVEISKSGTYALINSGGTCFTTCTGPSWVWTVATTTLVGGLTQHSGHQALGYSHVIFDNGSPQFCQQNIRLLSAPTNPTAIFPATCPAGFNPPGSQHQGWQNADPIDTAVFFTTTTMGGRTPYGSAWWDELDALTPGGNPVYRIAHTYNSDLANAGLQFDTRNAIGNCSQRGDFCMWSTDGMGGFGSTAGASTCTIGASDSTRCRGDVLIGKVQ